MFTYNIVNFLATEIAFERVPNLRKTVFSNNTRRISVLLKIKQPQLFYEVLRKDTSISKKHHY